MSRLRVFGSAMMDTLIAVFGTAVIESSIPHGVPHSGAEVIWRVWITSTTIALLLGVLVTHYRSFKTGIWAWVIPAGIFLFRALVYVSDRSTGLVTHFSGYDCAITLEKSDCNEFLTVSVPLIRGVAYAIGAILTLQISAWRHADEA